MACSARVHFITTLPISLGIFLHSVDRLRATRSFVARFYTTRRDRVYTHPIHMTSLVSLMVTDLLVCICDAAESVSHIRKHSHNATQQSIYAQVDTHIHHAISQEAESEAVTACLLAYSRHTLIFRVVGRVCNTSSATLFNIQCTHPLVEGVHNHQRWRKTDSTK
jgi:hypothetical protein